MFYDHVYTTFYSDNEIFIRFYFCDKRSTGKNQSVSMLWEDVARSPSTIALNVSLGHGKCSRCLHIRADGVGNP